MVVGEIPADLQNLNLRGALSMTALFDLTASISSPYPCLLVFFID
jgi:hypothetical protein